jgi:hypothetical protein
MVLRTFCGWLLFGLTVVAAAGQPVRGIVWDPPARTELAEIDLIEMHALGAQAVRTPLLRNDRLYRLADSLGLALYQDLPFAYLSGAQLADTLQYAEQLIQEAMWWARDHPSARHFGLARFFDTSDDPTCDTMRAMARPFREEGPADIQLYYLTLFSRDDRCAEVVDLVLLDALDAQGPLGRVQAWQMAHPAFDGLVGIGQIGTWVIDGRDEDGTRVPHSRSFQARYFETHLPVLLADTLATPPATVFVYRWRDRRHERPSFGHDLANPLADTYGLHSLSGERRLAFAVVEGIFTGRQTVFAFPAGHRPSEATPWVILGGWTVLLLLGFAFFRYTRFQAMVRRYFFAHGFYRESVAQGREMMFVPNLFVMTSLVIASGLTFGVILEGVREKPAFALVARGLPESTVLSIVALLDRPLMLTLVLGSVFALGVLLWTSVLSALSSRNRRPLLPGQTLLLVGWPHWTVLPAMLAAMVVSTLRQPEAATWTIVLAFAVFMAGVGASLRTLRDYRQITRARWPRLLVALAGNPLIILTVLGLYLAVRHWPQVVFMLHLVWRG